MESLSIDLVIQIRKTPRPLKYLIFMIWNFPDKTGFPLRSNRLVRHLSGGFIRVRVIFKAAALAVLAECIVGDGANLLDSMLTGNIFC